MSEELTAKLNVAFTGLAEGRWTYAEAADYIEQAFKDSDYRKLNFDLAKKYDETMTGPEFYERFEKVVKDDPLLIRVSGDVPDAFRRAVKKAAGLES